MQMLQAARNGREGPNVGHLDVLSLNRKPPVEKPKLPSIDARPIDARPIDARPIDARVDQSLRRHGFTGIHVTHRGNGAIRLELGGIKKVDRAMVIAIARTVAGVTAVSR